MTVQLLTHISHQLVSLANHTSMALPPTLTIAFQPTHSSLLCNTFWFISLSLSITCALLATLVEQWAREFLHKTEKRPSPIRRARVFSFLYFGVRRFGMHAVVDLIPLLLHVSLKLFLAGLIAFLFPINHLLMALISAIFALFLMMYALLTMLPIITLDCPYHTPFSGLFWRLIHTVRDRLISETPYTGALPNMNDATINLAMENSEYRDRRAFTWTLDSLTDHDELLPFLEAIPEAIHGARGFHLVNDHLFIPLLNGSSNQASIGARIMEVLFSCRNLVPGD
jgi:hypothetical protein